MEWEMKKLESLSDCQLLELFKVGNMQAFEIIVNRYKGKLMQFIYYSINDRNLSEDIFQEAFLRVIENVDKFKEKRNFQGWLFTIAHNIIVDKMRRKSKLQFVSMDTVISENDESLHLEDILEDDKEIPSQVLENKEIQKILMKSLGKLSFEQKQVFIMREIDNLSFKEISSILNISINTALSRMHYAVRNLRKILFNFKKELQ
jgi:RNA polymerase sigma-70 factor (ECF subfamily)